MCGIAGIHRRTDKLIPKLDRLANELLLAIEARGEDATGFLTMMDDGKVQLEKKPIPASKFIESRGRMCLDAKTVLLHTRWATVGSPFDPRNAHPVASGKVAAIHNGTLYNADEIFRTFSLPRIGTVDSEVVPALINFAGWDSMKESLSLLRGGAALVIVHTEHPDEVILARLKHYPLVYAVTDDVVIWASTEVAIRKAWYKTYGVELPVEATHLTDGQVIRVNGSVELIAWLRIPTYKPKTRPKPKLSVKIKTAPAPRGRAKGKKARQRAGVPSLAHIVPSKGYTGFWPYNDLAPLAEVVEYSSSDEIEDLMDAGLTRAEARRIVADALEWRDDSTSLLGLTSVSPGYRT